MLSAACNETTDGPDDSSVGDSGTPPGDSGMPPGDSGMPPGDSGTLPPVGVADAQGCDPVLVHALPNALWFRHQVVGTASAAQTVLVRNRGRTHSALTSVGTLPGFSITAPTLPVALAPGEEVALEVTHLATAAGVQSGIVDIEFNGAPTEGLYLWGAAGAAAPAEVSVTECGVLDQEWTVYRLANDVTATGNCFSVQADHVTLDLDGYTIRYGSGGADRVHGVVVAATWAPNADPAFSGGSAAGLEVTNGSIVQDPGAGEFAHGVFVNQINATADIALSYLTVDVSSPSSVNIEADYKSYLHVHHNELTSTVDVIQSRHQFHGAVIRLVDGDTEYQRVHDNEIVGGAQAGILSRAAHSQIYLNDIRQNANYTNDFSVVGTGTDTDVFDNVIRPLSGRGILVSGIRVRAFENDIEATELANNDEYGGCQIGGAYAIQVENGAEQCLVFANRAVGIADACEASALKATEVRADTGNRVCHNRFEARRIGATIAGAYGVTFSGIFGGMHIIGNEIIADTALVHFPWDGGIGAVFDSNLFIRGDNPVPAGDGPDAYWTLLFGNSAAAEATLIDSRFDASVDRDAAFLFQVGGGSGWHGPAEYTERWSVVFEAVDVGGAAVADATVVVTDALGAEVVRETTDAAGSLRATLTERRRYADESAADNIEMHTPHQISVTAAGYADWSQELSATEPAVIAVELLAL
ncbi:MAG: hypothetical protein DRJ42_21335 [Deltaproteobacteria bacterium]|nr:MAG: hypothetical protein DRJ42_21335 [Deltaproteobacteria bacterium]